MIYFDNAATTLKKPAVVADAVYRGLISCEFGNPGRGAHVKSLKAITELYKTRASLARLLSLENTLNIALTQNGSASLNYVLHSLFSSGDHIISSDAEHNSVLRPLYALEKQQIKVSHVPLSKIDGTICYEKFEPMVEKNTKAIVITHSSNVTGNKTDLRYIHQICKKYNLMLIVDASQTIGCTDINISDFSNSIFCFTGHKGLFGPGGTGGIAVNGDFEFRQVFSGGSGVHSFDHEHPKGMPDIFEVGTLNVPGFMGLNAGVNFVMDTGLENIERHLYILKNRFITGLQSIPKVKIYGRVDNETDSSVVGINLGDKSSSEISQILDEEYGIETRPGAHCAPRVHETFGTVEQGIVRFSFSYFNTIEEVDSVLNSINDLSKKLFSFC